ncbi:BON domain-containing protein [Roseateles sp.]|uniref:BON domain-containing protein n=1 Tax=Roseateles sp. TaxID=1971397 RepID=UPI0025E1D631|nr:BON domain-containing protein [Roseateles sp.]MBV8034374.1 BON domain-containing protein [Roseateles sp.]
MKFPKSMHAEGFYDHIDTSAPAASRSGSRPIVKAGARPLLREAAVAAPPAERTPAAPATRAATPAPRAGAAPWIWGAGAAILLIGLVVAMSHNLSGPEPVPAAVVGQASLSPEDAQLQSAPPGAGPGVTAPEPAPAVTEAPVAVAPKVEPLANVERAEPSPAPRAPTPRTETLAQGSPPPIQLREPALLPLPVATPPPAVAPPEAAPVAPPLAQQTPPATSDPEDSGITVKVRLALAADAALAAVPIAVSTEHGVVKLEGQAPDAQVRERATVVAAATTGVKAVDNRLTLPPLASLEPQRVGNGG